MAGLLRRAASGLGPRRGRRQEHVRACQRRPDGHRVHDNTGAHLELREGTGCTDSVDARSPHDADIGPAQLGDQTGELMSLNSGYVLYLDPGRVPSWTVTGTGLDQPTFTRLSAALALVGP